MRSKDIIAVRLLVCIGIYLLSFSLSANDGSYYMSGNQLIPTVESDIKITSELLRISRIDQEWVKISVDYVFENPRNAKQVIVGFEASAPSGDANINQVISKHPYMRDFSVVMNGTKLPYQTTIVSGEHYIQQGKITGVKSLAVDGPEDLIDKMFVYYFNADFLKGTNRIHHEYTYHMSSSVISWCGVAYVLTAANRWANHQIDDFTLQIDMGEYTAFSVEPTFFHELAGWQGIKKRFEQGMFQSWIQGKDPIVFRQFNFHPDGELNIIIPKAWSESFEEANFNCANDALNYNLMDFGFSIQAADDASYKILRNYPYARRGFVFKTDFIRAYYERMPWYFKDEAYIADPVELDPAEQTWLTRLNKKYK